MNRTASSPPRARASAVRQRPGRAPAARVPPSDPRGPVRHWLHARAWRASPRRPWRVSKLDEVADVVAAPRGRPEEVARVTAVVGRHARRRTAPSSIEAAKRSRAPWTWCWTVRSRKLCGPRERGGILGAQRCKGGVVASRCPTAFRIDLSCRGSSPGAIRMNVIHICIVHSTNTLHTVRPWHPSERAPVQYPLLYQAYHGKLQ